MNDGATESTQRSACARAIRQRVKAGAVVLLLVGIGFIATGCHDEYYGQRSVRRGYYASYGAPGPYYGYDPYPYGYGYAPGVAVGVSSYRYRPAYVRRPYYGRGDYSRSGYYRRTDRRRNWDERGSGERRRSWDRRGARSERSPAIRRSTAPDADRTGAPVETQPE